MQRPDGTVVPGLYAAGACASNIAQDGKGYSSGTQLGEGSFFGRRAGRARGRHLQARLTGEGRAASRRPGAALDKRRVSKPGETR